MNKKYHLPLFAATLFATGTFAAPELPPGDPYGVCTHVDSWEFKLSPQMFTQMKELSLKQVRTDFTWRAVNPKPGEKGDLPAADPDLRRRLGESRPSASGRLGGICQEDRFPLPAEIARLGDLQ